MALGELRGQEGLPWGSVNGAEEPSRGRGLEWRHGLHRGKSKCKGPVAGWEEGLT